ncbi:MAG TPA: hypothetical protein VMV10_24760 [Pirellulales bacterium]|nr:hypothetical protein [Pirellulales bacterium]
MLRLLPPAIVLPALVVLSDEGALRLGASCRWSTTATLGVFGWFVFQTALLSYVAGWKLPNWPWRLLLLGWTLVLVNLLLTASSLDAGWTQRMLGLAFLTGQIGSLVIWLLLGGVAWVRRAALLALAALPVTYLSSALQFRWKLGEYWMGDAWTVIVFVQLAGGVALAALLRLWGYRVESYCETASNGATGPIQFSIRHMLIATAAVAVVVPIVQRMLEASSRTLSGWQWLHASADGAILALVSLSALWMTLGAGRWPLKFFVFIVLASTAGAGLNWLESSIRYISPWGAPVPLTDLGLLWLAWTLLTGSFLAGMLLVLRGSGFRLVKRAR